MATQTICSVPGCGKNDVKRGWCESHYRRWTRHGTPTGGRVSPGEPLAWLLAHIDHEGEGCLIWPFGRLPKGYGKFRRPDGSETTAHRYMCEVAHGEPPTPNHEAAHSCGKGFDACVHPGHLRWATRSENHADKVEHGTDQRGEKHHMSVLSAGDIQEIRSLSGVMTQREIAAKFGISQAHVSNIIRRKRWAAEVEG